DHLVQPERERLIALIRAVEDFAIIEPAMIIHFDFVRGLRELAVSLAVDAVFESGLRRRKCLGGIFVDLSRAFGKLWKSHFFFVLVVLFIVCVQRILRK